MKQAPSSAAPEQTLDTCGHRCPVPVLMTRRALAGLRAGAVLEVLTTDARCGGELDLLCRMTGDELLSVTPNAPPNPIRILIRRGIMPAI